MMIVYVYGMCLWLPVGYWILGKVSDNPMFFMFREPMFRAMAAVLLATMWPIHLGQLLWDNWRALAVFMFKVFISFHHDYLLGPETFTQWVKRVRVGVKLT